MSRLYCRTKVVSMAQHQARLKYRIGFARGIHAAPPADGEFAQVTPAFKPDRTQVFIQLVEGNTTNHLRIEPKSLS